MIDDLIAMTISSLDMEQLEKVETAVRARRAQLISQRIAAIPLYAHVRFWRDNEAHTGVLMRHLRRSILVDAGTAENTKVDYNEIDWRDFPPTQFEVRRLGRGNGEPPAGLSALSAYIEENNHDGT